MFYALIIFLTTIELLLQVSVLPFLDIQNVFPDLILVTAILWLVLIGFDFSVGFSVACGFILDLYSRSFIGGHVVAFIVMLFVLRLVSEKYFPRQTMATTLLLGVLGTVIFQITLVSVNQGAALLGLTSFSVDSFQFFVYVMPLSIVWTSILIMLLWRFFQKLSDVIQYFQHRSKNT